MSYPERPTCHDDDAFAQRFSATEWKVREAEGAYGVNKRHCSYCGSLHPEDLVSVLEQGATLELADMKYGWPHKFYVSGISNPLAGEIVKMGSSSGPMKDEASGEFLRNEDGSIKRYDIPHMEPAPKTLTMKFYSLHLLDLKGTPEFDIVAKAICKASRVLPHWKEETEKMTGLYFRRVTSEEYQQMFPQPVVDTETKTFGSSVKGIFANVKNPPVVPGDKPRG